MADTLLELAERCEAAEGADGALFLDICHALNDLQPPGDYTASLDAAMTLKPEGWRVAGLFERNCQLPNWIWKVELWHPEADQNVRGIARNADNPALALCAAALRAISHQEQKP